MYNRIIDFFTNIYHYFFNEKNYDLLLIKNRKDEIIESHIKESIHYKRLTLLESNIFDIYTKENLKTINDILNTEIPITNSTGLPFILDDIIKELIYIEKKMCLVKSIEELNLEDITDKTTLNHFKLTIEMILEKKQIEEDLETERDTLRELFTDDYILEVVS
jgi:hypothetical protein